MVIQVTYTDIEEGNKSFDACPVTIALRREFKNNKISVSRNFIRVPKRSTKDWKLIPLPAAAREFLLNYYLYLSPQPFIFVVPKKDISALKG